jgi:hypothetical protein
MASYKIKIGSFKCAAISDGFFKYKPPMFPNPGKLLFANAPKESLELTLREHRAHDRFNHVDYKSLVTEPLHRDHWYNDRHSRTTHCMVVLQEEKV